MSRADNHGGPLLCQQNSGWARWIHSPADPFHGLTEAVLPECTRRSLESFHVVNAADVARMLPFLTERLMWQGQAYLARRPM